MAEVVPSFRTPVLGPSPYPTDYPRATKIAVESEEWPTKIIEFDAPYTQALLLSNARLRKITLEYTNLDDAEWTALRNYWDSVNGPEGIFVFRHPTRAMVMYVRFAEDFQEWSYYDPASTRTTRVVLEEVPR